MKYLARNAGYTLIELLIVIIVVVILMALVLIWASSLVPVGKFTLTPPRDVVCLVDNTCAPEKYDELG